MPASGTKPKLSSMPEPLLLHLPWKRSLGTKVRGTGVLVGRQAVAKGEGLSSQPGAFSGSFELKGLNTDPRFLCQNSGCLEVILDQISSLKIGLFCFKPREDCLTNQQDTLED